MCSFIYIETLVEAFSRSCIHFRKNDKTRAIAPTIATIRNACCYLKISAFTCAKAVFGSFNPFNMVGRKPFI